MRVLVIGAGLGGLAAAAHLLGDGHDVTVVEQAPRPGGRAGLVERDGFRLDTGPTVMTMPGLLDEVFTAAGRDMASYVRLKPVDPMYRATFADGSVLDVRHGRAAMTDEVRAFSGPQSADAFERFADWLTELYRVEMPNFIDTDYDSVLDLVRRWRAGARLARLGGFGRLGRKVASFFDDERLQRIFGFQAMYAGVAPYEALALYAVITYMDSIEGVFVPDGGMHAMVTGLADALDDAGASFRYGVTVTRIARDGTGAATGVELAGGERLTADAVVCNADLPVAYRTLLDGVDAPRVARSGRYSPSCLLWVAGVRGAPPAGAAHHNLHFGRQWDESFRALIGDGRLMPDPSILVTLHSLDDPSLAPPGCSTLYALEPVPNLDGRIDWTSPAGPAPSNACADRSPTPGTRPTWSPRRSTTRSTGRPWGWSGERRSPWPTRSARPGRSAHATSTGGYRDSCSSGRRPCPASVSRWSSCPASWRRHACGDWGRRRDGDAGGQLRRVQAGHQARRHDLLLVDDGPAGGQAPARPRAVRVLQDGRRRRGRSSPG